MKIVVTGGAGFIGSAFLLRMVPRHPEHHFINLDKLTYAANPLSLAPLEGRPNYGFVRLDVAEREAVGVLFSRERPDAVVHFAAESHVDRSILGPGEFIRTNVEGTFVLLEAARALMASGHPFVRFHHVSTDEVYGSLGQTGLFTEETRYDPSSPYSASKAASDHLVRAWARTYGLPATITNCSNNYGPRQFPEKLIPLMIGNLLARKPLPIYGRGVNVRDWLYVDDHVDAIWTVLTAPLRVASEAETYNVGGKAERRNVDVVDALCRIVAAETNASPEALLSLKTYVADRPGHDLRYAIDGGKIERVFGWTPSETFETGLARTVRWYLENQAWVQAIESGEHERWIRENYRDRSRP